jgi:hypothetical protein
MLIKERYGRLCSERYNNHFKSDLKSNRYLEGEWTYEEVKNLEKHIKKFKNRWVNFSINLLQGK